MTRVSDVAPFAEAVAREGGLPFIALALLRRPEVERLLEETARQVAGRPWGVGLLGFVPPDLREEQLVAVRAARPPFALIAGGRPDQAAELERDGIATYLHVPSPGLLDQYLRAGARRFVLEGRECGGHVGPRSSFVLWEQACRVLEAAIEGGVAAESLSVVFAGGIHDARSAALVAAMAGDLAARGSQDRDPHGHGLPLHPRGGEHRRDRVRGFRTRPFAAARPCSWKRGRAIWCASAPRRSSTDSRRSASACCRWASHTTRSARRWSD